MSHASCASINGLYSDEPVDGFWVEQFMDTVGKDVPVVDTSGTKEEVAQWIREAKSEHTALVNAIIDFLAERQDTHKGPGHVAMRLAIRKFFFE